MSRYYYGMKYRGFSPGCQPMKGFIERTNPKSGSKYFDIIVYDRELSDKEEHDYELEFIMKTNEGGV